MRYPQGNKDGIYLIGGFVGELIVTFTCLLDYILANPQNQNFVFGQEQVEAYLKDLLVHENFVDGILTLHLARDPTIKEKVITSHWESHREEAEVEEERIHIDD